jgi:O-methyltransferase involved in polyketide biosynthesis
MKEDGLKMNQGCGPVKAGLCGVPETMLWTLHNRASESVRQDAWFRDEHAERIYRSIDYDYRRSFGPPDSSHAVRSMMFDEALRPWMENHPGGTVVELGCGLETQFQRIDDGKVQWLCVDVPEAIDVRERFLSSGPRCRHVRRSALDRAWMDEVDGGAGVFVTAQGLFMYFTEEQVRELLLAILERFPGVEIMFDTIPPWFSRKTMAGMWKTPHYRTPQMPWGVLRNEIDPLLRGWSPRVESVTNEPYRYIRAGFFIRLFMLLARLPVLGNHVPVIVRVRGKKA